MIHHNRHKKQITINKVLQLQKLRDSFGSATLSEWSKKHIFVSASVTFISYMKMRYKIHTVKAFNLQEMLLVLALIGILLLIALPNFLPLIAQTKAQEAKIQLKTISNMQTQYRYLNSKYSSDFNEINYEAPVTVKNGGTANYSYEIIEASMSGFKARASAVVDFDGDGVFNVWEIDEKGSPKQLIKD
ncbi:prepilin-type N-terminal cleavage/methylation domain-containing protein [Aquimarina sp. TRL1]|uniref:prepilin-type N-terminal cleavage/methylation domain-containing protein n=1 Tax=Aquimarina sp. (strain TRL1) TaxID=2736252 RepID=UPI0034CD47A6